MRFREGSKITFWGIILLAPPVLFFVLVWWLWAMSQP